MNTTNVILIGVVGVGAVGAYMYMKNKKAQDNLLSGSLPATTPSGTPLLATPPLATTNQGGVLDTIIRQATAPTGTPPALSTESDGISPSDANLNLANATVLASKRAIVFKKAYGGLRYTTSVQKDFLGNFKEVTTSNFVEVGRAKEELKKIDANLAKLGYKVTSGGRLVKI
jgi:hypothetical protein